MSERRTGCPAPDLLVDLALGQLDGRERGAALEHLVGCPSCRDEVQRLVDAAELTLAATGEAEPPIGFEAGVFEAIRREQQASRPARRRLPAVLAVAAAVAAAVVGFVAGARVGGTQSPVREAAMLTDTGRTVGSAWAYDDDPAWLLISVPAWTVWEDPAATPHRYVLHAGLTDGSEVDLGEVTFRSDGSWATTTAIDLARIATVAIVDDTGREWCRGSF